MNVLPKSIQNLIEEFAKLPGIGPKSAARITYYYLKSGKDRLISLSKLCNFVAENINECSVCGNFSEENICDICSSSQRNIQTVVVVEEPLDINAIESIGSYTGRYFVLGGVISPVNGVGPDDIRINELIKFIKTNNEIEEIVIAIDSNLEGEATMEYIVGKINENNIAVKITTLARGIPTGADIDYADEKTLKKAFEARTSVLQ